LRAPTQRNSALESGSAAGNPPAHGAVASTPASRVGNANGAAAAPITVATATASGITPDDVYAVLKSREGTSGLEEKASRKR